jgi:hypothetical protein
MNRLVLVLRLRKAARAGKFLAPIFPVAITSAVEGTGHVQEPVKRTITWGPSMDSSNIFCDFSIVVTGEASTASNLPPKLATSLKITENDTVEEILQIWMDYVGSPMDGLGSIDMQIGYEQLLAGTKVVDPATALTFEAVESLLKSPVPYCFDAFPIPASAEKTIYQQYILAKFLRTKGPGFYALEEVEKELDLSLVQDKLTLGLISERVKEIAANNEMEIRDAGLFKFWIELSSIYQFSTDTITTLIRMDSMDLDNFVHSLGDAASLNEQINKITDMGLQLNSGFNWVTLHIQFCSSFNVLIC